MRENNTEATGGVRECPECGSLAFGDEFVTCCGGRMNSVEASPVVHPDLKTVLRDVFGISETGLEVCICLMEDGEATSADIAERLDIDRSTVGRQLNHLADIGLLEKRQRLLKDGRYVHVYSPVPVEEVRERLTVGLYAWVGEALELVENVNREKVKALTRADGEGSGDGRDGDDEGPSIYWDE